MAGVMRSPVLVLLASLQIIHMARQSIHTMPTWKLEWMCRSYSTRIINYQRSVAKYGRCVTGSFRHGSARMCCILPYFLNKHPKFCEGIRNYRRKRSARCNPTEHVVIKVDNTKPYVAPTCDSLIAEIKKSTGLEDGLDTFKCPEAKKKCGTHKALISLPECCDNPVLKTENGCQPTTTTARTTTKKVYNTNRYCRSLSAQIKRISGRYGAYGRNVLSKCPVAVRKCGTRALGTYLINCCLHPAIASGQRTREYCRRTSNYRRKRADFDSKRLDPSPDTSYAASEVSDSSLWNMTEKSTNNLPLMFLETDVTTSNTSLDVPKYRNKREVTFDPPVLSASMMDELTENSPEATSVTCCGDSTLTTMYCGANTGIKCSTVCGNQAGNQAFIKLSNYYLLLF